MPLSANCDLQALKNNMRDVIVILQIVSLQSVQ
jgi:hypothetical protein